MHVCADPIPFWLSLTIDKPYQTTLGNLTFLRFYLEPVIAFIPVW